MFRRRPAAYVAATVLSLIGVLGTLWAPIYARSTPKWGPVPFFYWYQLAWVPVVGILCWFVYLILRTKPRRRASTLTSPRYDRRGQV